MSKKNLTIFLSFGWLNPSEHMECFWQTSHMPNNQLLRKLEHVERKLAQKNPNSWKVIQNIQENENKKVGWIFRDISKENPLLLKKNFIENTINESSG